MRLATLGIALVALAAWLGWSQAEGSSHGKRRIATEQEYRDTIVGKRLVGENGYVVKHANGTISGKLRGKKVTGKWKWKGKYWCRTVKLGSKSLGSDCQTIFLEGDQLTGRRKKGKGEPFAFRVQEP